MAYFFFLDDLAQTGERGRHKLCLARMLLLDGEGFSVDFAADRGRFKLRLGKQQEFSAYLAVP